MRIGLIIAFVLVHLGFLRATHLIGGEMYYDCLGNNQYRVTLVMYRDCGPTNSLGTGFDPTVNIGVFENNSLITTFSMFSPTISNIPAILNDPCLVAPPQLCVQKAIYQTNVFINQGANPIQLVYQRCCRSPQVVNLSNPGNYGSTIVSTIPPASVAPCNSSPRFNNQPPLAVCGANPFLFDHVATDPDGDVLVYEMATPFTGGSSTNPAPNPPTPPPYNQILWGTGFSANAQVVGNPTLTINANTGVITGTPTNVGIYTIGIKVSEFRNGVLLGSTLRDYVLTIANCDPLSAAIIQPQDPASACNGLTANFNGGASIGGQSYQWDFGDGNASSDVNPTHTFAQPGIYTITLIVNPGLSCADTTTSLFVISDPIVASFQLPDPQCVTGNSFNFLANGSFDPAIASFSWDFGTMANPGASALIAPTGIVFADSGHYPVTLQVDQYGCLGVYTDTVTVFPIPVIGAVLPNQVGCDPYSAQFMDSTLSWTPVTYQWQFGDGAVSNDAEPLHVYDQVGVYDVTLTIEVDSGCAAIQTVSFPGAVVVNPSPVADFVVTPEETDVFTPEFEVQDASQGAIDWYYTFPDGDTLFFRSGAFRVDRSGFLPITQHVINEYSCPDTAVQTVFIEPITTIYAPNAFSPNGDLVNDVWKPVVRDVEEYELFVFNRWGNVIFNTANVEMGWDGTYQSKESPVDAYTFKIVYKGVDRIRRIKTGHITLVR